jgi:predicted HicB family RNase H-like nuclease
MARPRSTKQRKQYGLRLDPQLMRELAHLSVDEQKWLNELTEEAICDLLKKYRDKSNGKG